MHPCEPFLSVAPQGAPCTPVEERWSRQPTRCDILNPEILFK